MHLSHLKKHKHGLYTQLILSGKLNRYMSALNDRAQARLGVIIRQMRHSEGVDETMKTRYPMLWIGRMNSIRRRAGENAIVEIVFA